MSPGRRYPSFLACSALALAACVTLKDPAPDVASLPADPVADAGDASAKPDAPAPLGFCRTLAPVPTFCEDFDGDLQAAWAERDGRPGVATGGAAFDLDSTIFASGGRAMRFSVPLLLDERGRATAMMVALLPANPPVFDLAADVRLEHDLPASAGGKVQIFALSFGTRAGYAGIFRSATRWSMYAFERVGSELVSTDVTLEPLPPGQWRTLRFSYRAGLPSEPGELSASFGGPPVTLAAPPGFRGEDASGPSVSVGAVVASGPIDGFQMYVDDFRFTAADR